mmetsp:Transcript_36049/g.86797  ORF Transcript_36049/g.86797 Transcript_36049/m.86797 type:complete len:230 (-) Transcript_36049:793-1482(-)
MLNAESFPGSTKTGIAGMGTAQLVEELRVHLATFLRMRCTRRVIQHGKNPGRAASLDKQLHIFVVAKSNRSPLNFFSLIFILFRSQSELDEYLLQTLVDIIDAQLLKTVLLKYLEPVDIQHPDAAQVLRRGRLRLLPFEQGIQARHNVVKQPFEYSLRQPITRRRGLRDILRDIVGFDCPPWGHGLKATTPQDVVKRCCLDPREAREAVQALRILQLTSVRTLNKLSYK